MKKKLNTSKIFIFASILFLGTLAIIYGYRFIHYYSIEHQEPIEECAERNFYSYIMSYQNEENKMNNLNTFKYDEKLKENYFSEDAKNNYVNYSGRLWRILSIDSEKDIKLITDDIQSSLVYGEEENLLNSYINNWLNKSAQKNTGIFYDTLNEPEQFLINTNICEDVITNDITCTNVSKNNLIEQLSLYEYNRAGKEKSFLNINKIFWTKNINEKNEAWYITKEGKISNIDVNHHYGIRPVITLKGDITVTGTGTQNHPIKIELTAPIKITEASVGEYINYNNKTWRIINKTDSAIEALMSEPLENQSQFSSQNNTFVIKNTNNNIGYYLNNEFYNSLINKEYLKKRNYYIGKYKTDNFNYELLYGKTINCYVGLPKISDLFVTEYKNMLTLTGLEDNANNTIYSINNNNQVYSNTVTEKYNIYPVISFDNSLVINDGDGTKDDAYQIGRWTNETK